VEKVLAGEEDAGDVEWKSWGLGDWSPFLDDYVLSFMVGGEECVGKDNLLVEHRKGMEVELGGWHEWCDADMRYMEKGNV